MVQVVELIVHRARIEDRQVWVGDSVPAAWPRPSPRAFAPARRCPAGEAAEVPAPLGKETVGLGATLKGGGNPCFTTPVTCRTLSSSRKIFPED
jgi:hypothetical protein